METVGDHSIAFHIDDAEVSLGTSEATQARRLHVDDYAGFVTCSPLPFAFGYMQHSALNMTHIASSR